MQKLGMAEKIFDLIKDRAGSSKFPAHLDARLWTARMAACEAAAYDAVLKSKGKNGPFAAQLWLVNSLIGEHVLVGKKGGLFRGKDRVSYSNAVVSKSFAGAHAEAENLSPENRAAIKSFLKDHQNRGWEIVQLTTGQSCTRCYAAQVLFTQELINERLLTPKQFHVIYNTNFAQAEKDAGFSDGRYDRFFRALHTVIKPDRNVPWSNLRRDFSNSSYLDPLPQLMRAGKIVFIDVVEDSELSMPASARALFESHLEDSTPLAVIVKDDHVLGHGCDTRKSGDAVNIYEHTAINRAIHAAGQAQKRQGTEKPWDMKGASVYLNFVDVGPLDYATVLWANTGPLCYTSVRNEAAPELPGTNNTAQFLAIGAPYEDGPVNVICAGDGVTPGAAHLLWGAMMRREGLQEQFDSAIHPDRTSLLYGGQIPGTRLFPGARKPSTNYDGKQPDLK